MLHDCFSDEQPDHSDSFTDEQPDSFTDEQPDSFTDEQSDD